MITNRARSISVFFKEFNVKKSFIARFDLQYIVSTHVMYDFLRPIFRLKNNRSLIKRDKFLKQQLLPSFFA